MSIFDFVPIHSISYFKSSRFDTNLEERKGGMPFSINHQFKLAIAFAQNCFKFAVDGVHIKDFDFPYRRDGRFPELNGFKIYANDVRVEVSEIEHLYMEHTLECEGFQKYSCPRK